MSRGSDHGSNMGERRVSASELSALGGVLGALMAGTLGPAGPAGAELMLEEEGGHGAVAGSCISLLTGDCSSVAVGLEDGGVPSTGMNLFRQADKHDALGTANTGTISTIASEAMNGLGNGGGSGGEGLLGGGAAGADKGVPSPSIGHRSSRTSATGAMPLDLGTPMPLMLGPGAAPGLVDGQAAVLGPVRAGCRLQSHSYSGKEGQDMGGGLPSGGNNLQPPTLGAAGGTPLASSVNARSSANRGLRPLLLGSGGDPQAGGSPMAQVGVCRAQAAFRMLEAMHTAGPVSSNCECMRPAR